MFGLIIAAFIFLFGFLADDSDQPALYFVASTFGFLWVWHWIWASVKAVVACGIGVLGLIAAGTGNAWGLAILFASPVIVVLMLISSALFLSAVYCLQLGISVDTGEVISEKHLISGVVIYGIGCLIQLGSKVSTSSSKD